MNMSHVHHQQDVRTVIIWRANQSIFICISFSLKAFNSGSGAEKTVLVYFLGGCSYTEIAALKLLGKQKGNWKSFMILRSSI